MNASRFSILLTVTLLLVSLALASMLAGCNDPRTNAAGSPLVSGTSHGSYQVSPEEPASSDQEITRARSDSYQTPPEIANYNGEILDRSFDDIKFEMLENQQFDRSLLTPKVEDLFGKRIRIRGYIFPTLKKRGLKQFVLVRDNLECCFGPGAALFDCILVSMHPGQTAEFSTRPVAVEGTFDYRVEDIEGIVVAIYTLRGECVK